MGMHASADLFFGVLLYDPEGDENPDLPFFDPESEDEDEDSGVSESFENWAAEKFGGITRPDFTYPARTDVTPEAESIKQAFTAYWNAKHEFLKSLPVEVDSVGHHEFSRYYLKLREWGARVGGYDCDPVEPDKLAITNDHRMIFANAMAYLGLELPDPQIHLAASYG